VAPEQAPVPPHREVLRVRVPAHREPPKVLRHRPLLNREPLQVMRMPHVQEPLAAG